MILEWNLKWRAVRIENLNGLNRLHWRFRDADDAVRRPVVEIKPPGLCHQAEPGLALQVFARRGNERGEQRILLRVIKTQMRPHLGKRQRLRGGRSGLGIGHGAIRIRRNLRRSPHLQFLTLSRS
jgi:hypothetical protein